MIWMLAAIGLLLTALGATAGAALVSVSRVELAQMVSHRLRGGRDPLTRLGQVNALLTAASATTSLGVVILGAAVPAAVSGSALKPLALAAVVLAIPAVMFGGFSIAGRFNDVWGNKDWKKDSHHVKNAHFLLRGNSSIRMCFTGIEYGVDGRGTGRA